MSVVRARHVAILFVTALLAFGLVAAEERASPWKPESPAPPMPDKWDWIELTSGEWLKGEIIALYEDKLEFDSDEMDLQTFDWEDVKHVRTGRIVRVGLLNQEKLVGKLYVEGEQVRVIGDEDLQIDRSQILSVVAGAPKEINYWSGKVTLGFNLRRGNSDILEANANVKFMRRTVKNRISIDYLGNNSVTESIETANNHRATFGWNRFINDRLYVSPTFFEWFRDPFQNISHRETLGVGVGYEIIDSPKLDWAVDAGPAYQRTRFVSVEAGSPQTENTPALVAGTNLDWEMAKWLDFLWEYRFQLVNEVSGLYNHHFVLGFETEITKMLDFDISFVWDRIQKPRPEENGVVPLQDDYRLIVGVTFDW